MKRMGLFAKFITYTSTMLAALVLLTQYAEAQAPAENGSQIPVALLFVGAFVLGLFMAYGILQNRKRTRAQKRLTEEATRENYRQEARNG